MGFFIFKSYNKFPNSNIIIWLNNFNSKEIKGGN